MGILTRGDDQVHRWWQVLEEKGEGIVNRFGIQYVVIVKNQGEMFGMAAISLSKAVRIDSDDGG